MVVSCADSADNCEHYIIKIGSGGTRRLQLGLSCQLKKWDGVWQGQAFARVAVVAFAWVAVVASAVQLELLLVAHAITVDPTLGLWALPRQQCECSCVTSSLFGWTGPHACSWSWLG